MLSDFRSLEEIQSRFSTEEACADYLLQMKWPDGYLCPRCAHRVFYRIATRRLPLLQCASCRYQTSPLAGTVMEGSRTDLRKWFTALFLISRTDCGMNASRLRGMIGVTYKTAWLICHKIRHAIHRMDLANLLSGYVHLDKAKYGPPFTTPFYLSRREFPVLVGVATRDSNVHHYVKIKLVPRQYYNISTVSRQGIDAFHASHIEPETVVSCTIGQRVNRKRMQAHPYFTYAHMWIKETFCGLGLKYLQRYLDEFCYRMNLKLQRQPRFASLVRLCTTMPAITYTSLIGRSVC